MKQDSIDTERLSKRTGAREWNYNNNKKQQSSAYTKLTVMSEIFLTMNEITNNNKSKFRARFAYTLHNIHILSKSRLTQIYILFFVLGNVRRNPAECENFNVQFYWKKTSFSGINARFTKPYFFLLLYIYNIMSCMESFFVSKLTHIYLLCACFSLDTVMLLLLLLFCIRFFSSLFFCIDGVSALFGTHSTLDKTHTPLRDNGSSIQQTILILMSLALVFTKKIVFSFFTTLWFFEIFLILWISVLRYYCI